MDATYARLGGEGNIVVLEDVVAAESVLDVFAGES